MRKVHGVGASPYVRKVRVALAEKGLDYELVPVMPFNVSDDFKKISPLGKIPVLEDEGQFIPDSSVILDYLENTQPTPSLIPKDARQRAQALFLEEFADGGIAAKGTGVIFFQRVIGPMFMGQPTDEAAVDKAIKQDMPPLLGYLESQLAGGKEFLVGNSISVADIAVTSQFVNLSFANYSVDAAAYPNLAKYLARMFERESFAKCIGEDRAAFGR